MATSPTVTAVESTVKTDTSKVVASAESFYKTELAKAKAELAALEAKTYTFKTVAIVGALGVVVGFLLHLL